MAACLQAALRGQFKRGGGGGGGLHHEHDLRAAHEGNSHRQLAPIAARVSLAHPAAFSTPLVAVIVPAGSPTQKGSS